MLTRHCTLLAALLVPLLLAAVAALVPAPARADKDEAPKKLMVYVGTYAGEGSKGIYRMEMDLATGKLSAPALAGEARNPSFVALHPNGKFLYAVSEVEVTGGKRTGGVSAFALDPKTGDLKLLNQQPSGGGGPCHLVVDGKGKHALAANYGGGSACVLPIGADGKLGKATAVVQHEGKSVVKGRQDAAHAHSINLDAANRFAFVADLGLDKVMVYRYDAAEGKLTPNDPPALATAAGAGPRHFAFHPAGKFAYVINELNSTILAMSYDPKAGVLKPVQTVPTLPKGYKGKSTTAEVVVHPSGKFVYGSNRGHDSIAVFSADEKTGELTFVEHQGKDIKTPRNFAVDPTGAYLIVANQDAGSLLVFRVDAKTGRLTPTGHSAKVSRPVCVRFLPWAG